MIQLKILKIKMNNWLPSKKANNKNSWKNCNNVWFRIMIWKELFRDSATRMKLNNKKVK